MDKRVAIVTGASRGLGLGCAQALAERGYSVVMCARNANQLRQAAGVLIANGFNAANIVCDVGNETDRQQLAEFVESRYQRCDVLINNAGVFLEPHNFANQRPAPALSSTTTTLQQTIAINSLGPWHLIQLLLPLMQRHDYGRIVNVSSGMGALDQMGRGYPAYRLSKLMLNTMTHLIAQDLESSNIKINAVCPGWVKTEMGGEHATRELDQGVASIIWAAVLDQHGPSGGFFRDGKAIPW